MSLLHHRKRGSLACLDAAMLWQKIQGSRHRGFGRKKIERCDVEHILRPDCDQPDIYIPQGPDVDQTDIMRMAAHNMENMLV